MNIFRINLSYHYDIKGRYILGYTEKPAPILWIKFFRFLSHLIKLKIILTVSTHSFSHIIPKQLLKLNFKTKFFATLVLLLHLSSKKYWYLYKYRLIQSTTINLCNPILVKLLWVSEKIICSKYEEIRIRSFVFFSENEW